MPKSQLKREYRLTSNFDFILWMDSLLKNDLIDIVDEKIKLSRTYLLAEQQRRKDAVRDIILNTTSMSATTAR